MIHNDGDNCQPTPLAPPPGTNAPDLAMVPPLPPGASAPAGVLAFSRPCPKCRAIVSLPWCGIVSSTLDRIDALEAGVNEELAVLYARVGLLEATLSALQAHDAEEVQP